MLPLAESRLELRRKTLVSFQIRFRQAFDNPSHTDIDNGKIITLTTLTFAQRLSSEGEVAK